jgi:transcriptional regulator with XRE-family HTH domain
MQLTSDLAGKESCATRTQFAELATDFPWRALSVLVADAARWAGEALMDATHPIWRTPAVRQVATAGQFGALTRMSRTAQQLTLAQAGKLVGYSASTLSRIETGKRKLTDVTLLRRFADALGIPPDLFGLALPTGISPFGAAPPPTAPAATTVRETVREGGDDAVRRRELLAGLVGVTGNGLLGATVWPTSDPGRAAQPVGVQVLRDRLAAKRAAFDACRYHELAVTLPDVIATAQISLHESAGQQHEQIAALLADAYSQDWRTVHQAPR